MFRSINLYEISELIYESSEVSVVKAIRTVDGLNVIIKTINKDYPSSQELARIEHEYKILKKLDLVGIVKPIELYQYAQNLAIIFEYTESISLSKMIASGKRFTMLEFVTLAIEISKIISGIHHHNIIHMDINPSNILWLKESKKPKIIDFGISSELTRERSNLDVLNALKGTYPYISPEQTGRMNRYVDYRSDYYSLGVTLFEIITGKLPFNASDALGWIHAHVAKAPEAPCNIVVELPVALSNIILKLMSKNVEDRYQSGYGLIYDLELCKKHLEQKTTTTTTTNTFDFALGKRDISEKFQIPQKLYGRNQEIEKIMKIFQSVTENESEILLIQGSAGVGKSMLVNELQPLIVKSRGYFIEGKFDQFKKNIPYSAFIQAFQDLTKQLMSESTEHICKWKEIINNAIKPNGKIITNLFPDLEKVLGVQPPIPKFGAKETQNCFELTINSLIQVLATKDHPLVIFLDDLQWSDISTLNLIAKLIISKNIKNLFFILAYRDNELTLNHSIFLTIDEIKKKKKIHDCTIKPLDYESLSLLIADTLHQDKQNIAPLLEFVHQRTEANPFFVKELLKDLFQQECIGFSQTEGHWSWNMEKINRIKISSSIVDFMISRFQKLSIETITALQMAACIGNTFDLKSLIAVMKCSFSQTAKALWDALRQGIILPLSNDYKLISTEENIKNDFNVSYKFQHDRIQQAAYSMISEDNRKMVHLNIGRLLLNSTDSKYFSDRTIEIVRHLNKGLELISEEHEKIIVMNLNMLAGKKAKESSAYPPALNYFKLAYQLLPSNYWAKDYTFTFELHREYFECAFLCADFALAEQISSLALKNAKTPLEKAEIYRLQSIQHRENGQLDLAIVTNIKGIKALGLGVKIALKPSPFYVLIKYFQMLKILKHKSCEEILNLPITDDPTIRLLQKLFMAIGELAYWSNNKILMLLSSVYQIMFSLRYGNSTESAQAYVSQAVLYNVIHKNYKKSYEFGQMAIKLDQKFENIDNKSRIHALYAMFIHSWNNHYHTVQPYLKKASEYGYQTGDMYNMILAYYTLLRYKFDINFEDIVAEGDRLLNQIDENKSRPAWNLANIFIQTRRNLLGLISDRQSMSDDNFNEKECLQYCEQFNFVSGLSGYYSAKLQLSFFYENYKQGIYYARLGKKHRSSIEGMLPGTEFCYFSFLCYAQEYKKSSFFEKIKLKVCMKREYKKIKRQSDYSFLNFGHLALTMEAELLRIEGKNIQAQQKYNQAINAAQKNGVLLFKAIACELCAKFYLEYALEKNASIYMHEAYQIYTYMKVNNKVKHLLENYASLIKLDALKSDSRFTTYTNTNVNTKLSTHSSSSTTLNSSDGILDFASIIKAMQTLSQEIKLDSLLVKLIKIMQENAGATKAVLLTIDPNSNQLFIRAKSSEHSSEAVSGLEIFDEKNSQQVLPSTIIRYVEKFNKEIVLENAKEDSNYGNDPYIKQNNCKSILSLPISNQNKMVAILYFENILSTNVFTKGRIEVLNILGAQSAISIQNANWYWSLEEKVRERTEELKKESLEKEDMQKKMHLNSRLAAIGELAAGVAHEINNPLTIQIGTLFKIKKIVEKELSEDGSAKILPFIDKIQDTTNRMIKIINGLRSYCRMDETIEKEASILTQETFNVHEAINKTTDLVMSLYQEQNINIDLEFLAQQPLVKGDGHKFGQVIINLLSNARDALAAKTDSSRNIHVKTSTADESHIKIEIIDNGTGIAKENIDKIFNAFFTSKPIGQGTGLGLSIVHTIIKEMSGEINVTSKEGEGTSMTILLPMVNSG